MEILRKIDERGRFINIPVDKYKRMYVIQNHQLNTVRAFHRHNREGLLLYCLKGVWKVIYYPITTDNPQPIEKVISEGEYVEIPAPAGNGHINLTEGAILLCFADLSLEEVREEEVKEKWDLFGEEIWKIQPK